MGYGGNYKKINCLTVSLSLAIFGVLIAASATPWYKYDIQFVQVPVNSQAGSGNVQVGSSTLNTTSYWWDFVGRYTTTGQGNSRTASNIQTFISYDKLKSDRVYQTFQVAQAFTISALLLAAILAVLHALYFVDAIRNKALFWMGLTTLRFALGFLAILVLSSVIIAFLTFLTFTGALNTDQPNCTVGPCKKFNDATEVTVGLTTNGDASIVQRQQWGAEAGWYLVLASIPLSIMLVIVILLNKFPIPVDSVGTGEAL